MHDAGTAIEPAFYDHEDDAVPTREHAAADWGADEVFATVPRRRFRGERSALTLSPASSRPHVGAPAARSSEWRPLPISGNHDAPAPAPRGDALADLTPSAPPPPAPAVLLSSGGLLTSGVVLAPPATAWTEAQEPQGRRTVVVTGRPGGAPAPARPYTAAADRLRAPRSVSDRVGGRPDQIAGWSFGMGLLLIVVAGFS